jgi:hypothetical protein
VFLILHSPAIITPLLARYHHPLLTPRLVCIHIRLQCKLSKASAWGQIFYSQGWVSLTSRSSSFPVTCGPCVLSPVGVCVA